MIWLDADAAAVVLPVAASLGTLALAQRHAAKMAKQERAHAAVQAQEDRRFQAREARYADRRAAVIDFLAAASDETDAVVQFEREPGHEGLVPFDLYDDYEFVKFNAAFARLTVIAAEDVALAAQALRDAVYGCFTGETDSWLKYNEALRSFQDAARLMLAEDSSVSS